MDKGCFVEVSWSFSATENPTEVLMRVLAGTRIQGSQAQGGEVPRQIDDSSWKTQVLAPNC